MERSKDFISPNAPYARLGCEAVPIIAKAADDVGVFMAAINWPAVRRAYDGVRP